MGRTSDSGLPVVYSQTHFTPNVIIAIENASTVTVQPRVTYKASFSRKSIQICTSTRALKRKLPRFFVEICFYFSLYHCQCNIAVHDREKYYQSRFDSTNTWLYAPKQNSYS